MALSIKKNSVGNSFRWNVNGRLVKYLTEGIAQKQLQDLLDNDCPFVVEEKTKSKPKSVKKVIESENEENDNGTTN